MRPTPEPTPAPGGESPSGLSRRGFLNTTTLTATAAGTAGLLATGAGDRAAAATPIAPAPSTAFGPGADSTPSRDPLPQPESPPAAQDLSRLPEFSLLEATVQHFAPFVETTFRFLPDAQSRHDLELVEALALPRPESWPFRDPFRLVFHGPADLDLAQRTYAVEHDSLGAFDLFVVPQEPRLAGAPLVLIAIFC
jgi:hypothetical protein